MNVIFRVLCKSYGGVSCRSFYTSCSMRKDSFATFLFKTHGYNKYGLLQDDLKTEFSSVVEEAIKRLPEEEQMQRIHRAIKASQAEINHTVLPKDQWTKFEDNHNYLQPYINEIIKEKEEMEEWEANH